MAPSPHHFDLAVAGLREKRPSPTGAQPLRRQETLLPGAGEDGQHRGGRRLPLSTARRRPPTGRLPLAGDAADPVNSLTREGIHPTVVFSIAPGRAATEARCDVRPERAGERCARATRRILLPRLRHTAPAARLARLARNTRLPGGGLHASAADQHAFDGLVELGLARGRLSPTVALGLRRALGAPTRATSRPQEPA
ncbi:hypothetical protein [Streptomyces sp. MMG1533]|uniref:hypothetical protein n=1 Tax=Streptomyces sp. MMG1533 TaxID=1415546 RepID=UPI0006AF146F|nr:hypothetical protein [Streptomyces sp. MMG1533]